MGHGGDVSLFRSRQASDREPPLARRSGPLGPRRKTGLDRTQRPSAGGRPVRPRRGWIAPPPRRLPRHPGRDDLSASHFQRAVDLTGRAVSGRGRPVDGAAAGRAAGDAQGHVADRDRRRCRRAGRARRYAATCGTAAGSVRRVGGACRRRCAVRRRARLPRASARPSPSPSTAVRRVARRGVHHQSAARRAWDLQRPVGVWPQPPPPLEALPEAARLAADGPRCRDR